MQGCRAPQGQIRRELIRSAAMENARRSLLLYHYNNGVRKIHELMNLTGMKQSAVYNNLKKIKAGKPIQRKKGSGRKSRFSTSDRKRIIQLAIQNPLLSVDSLVYQDVLDEGLISTADCLYPDGWILQQDNARPHTSASTKKFFHERQINVLEWPIRSPDLNCIENLWSVLKQNLEKSIPTSLKDLESKIERAWEEISREEVYKLIESMPKRLQLCIEAQGGEIPY